MKPQDLPEFFSQAAQALFWQTPVHLVTCTRSDTSSCGQYVIQANSIAAISTFDVTQLRGCAMGDVCSAPYDEPQASLIIQPYR